MTLLDLGQFGAVPARIRQRARQSLHVQRARTMLVAAGLCSVGLVAVAATVLGAIF